MSESRMEGREVRGGIQLVISPAPGGVHFEDFIVTLSPGRCSLLVEVDSHSRRVVGVTGSHILITHDDDGQGSIRLEELALGSQESTRYVNPDVYPEGDLFERLMSDLSNGLLDNLPRQA